MKKLLGLFLFLISSQHAAFSHAATQHSYNMLIEGQTLTNYPGSPLNAPPGMADQLNAAYPIGSQLKVDLATDFPANGNYFNTNLQPGVLSVYYSNSLLMGAGSLTRNYVFVDLVNSVATLRFIVASGNGYGLLPSGEIGPQMEVAFGTYFENGVRQIDFNNLIGLNYLATNSGSFACSEYPDPCTSSYQYSLTATPAPVPLPSSIWLLGSGLMSLAGAALRKPQNV